MKTVAPPKTTFFALQSHVRWRTVNSTVIVCHQGSDSSMPKAIQKSKPSSQDWADSIRELRHKLRLSQVALGQRLHYSAMAISRWERGEQEPTDRGYIELGNLAGDPDCWYFWGPTMKTCCASCRCCGSVCREADSQISRSSERVAVGED